MNINHVTLGGNLCADPELRYLPSGSAVVNVNLANNRAWVDPKTKEKKEKVSFIRLALFGKTAELLAQHFRKGSPVLIEGRIEQESWDKDGKTESRTGVTVDRLHFLPGGKAESPRPAPAPKPEPKKTIEGEPDDVPF